MQLKKENDMNSALKFKTELHCHSDDISLCAEVNIDDIIKKYSDAGYTTLVLTNHFNQYTLDSRVKSGDWNEWVDIYVEAYEKLKRDAEGKLNILLGMELRFNENINDYLVFGITKQFLRDNPNILELNPYEFHPIAKRNGCLFVQAHPFRGGMVVIHPDALDGIEVFNGHKGHDSRNDIAEMWADKYGLIKTSGTDFHYSYAPANGGIYTDFEITSMDQLVEVLKSGNYTLSRD